MMTNTTATLSCAAVQSAWQVYMALPSPISATTGRSGSASLAPIAAGRPQPMPPPRSPKKLWGSSLRTNCRRPGFDETDSSITTASGGSVSPIPCMSASGLIGTVFASARARDLLLEVGGDRHARGLGARLRRRALRRSHSRLERRQQVLQRCLDVAEDRHLRGIVLTD